MGEARHSFTGPPRTRGRARREAHSMTRLHRRLNLRSPNGTLGMRVATRVTTRAVVNTTLMVTPGQASEPEPPPPLEGIGRLERQMDDFATVQMEMQASIDSQTSMMHDLFGHFGINPDA
jgi:hypothetical protein